MLDQFGAKLIKLLCIKLCYESVQRRIRETTEELIFSMKSNNNNNNHDLVELIAFSKRL